VGNPPKYGYVAKVMKELAESLQREWRRLLLELEQWNDDMAAIIIGSPALVFTAFGRERLMKQLSDQLDELTSILTAFAPLVIVGAFTELEDDVLFPDVPADGVLTRRAACGEAVRQAGRAAQRLFVDDPVPGLPLAVLAWTKTPPLWKFITKGLAGLLDGLKASLIIRAVVLLVGAFWKLGVGVGAAFLIVTMIGMLRASHGSTIRVLPQDSTRVSGVRWDRWRVR